MGYFFRSNPNGIGIPPVNFIPFKLKMKNIQGSGIKITFIKVSENPVFELHFSFY